MSKPIITVVDIASVRYAAPDLDLMEQFLADFGLHPVERTETTLHARGCGTDPFVHLTEKGDARTIGFALKARCHEDLLVLAEHLGTQVRDRMAPGGGQVVEVTDPDGNAIEVIHGFETRTATPSRAPFARNMGPGRHRLGDTVRVGTKPSEVLRLGHVALHTPRFAVMRKFYREMFGMRDSDTFYAGPTDNMIASFLHCGLGSELVDHHTVALIGDGGTGFEHSAFEVLDIDDLMSGNQYLKSRDRWKHSWGVGRHFQGSQVFDYWRDPFGNKIEHWTDGDLVNEHYPQGHTTFNPMTDLAQWGPPLQPEFFK
jgi:catechol 2,3-dioxygenase-like lactoylglutathione lyase family enzyme